MGNSFTRIWNKAKKGRSDLLHGDFSKVKEDYAGKNGLWSEYDPTNPNGAVGQAINDATDPYRSHAKEDAKANAASYNAATSNLDKAGGVAGSVRDASLAENKPWINAGQHALEKYQNANYNPQQFNYNSVDLQRDPSYQFRLQQGLKSMNQGAAAGGKMLSGQQQMALNNYAQNAASQEYGNAFNRAFQQNQYNNTIGRNKYLDTLGQQGRVMGMGFNAGQSNIGAQNNYNNSMQNIFGQKAKYGWNYNQMGKNDNRYYRDRTANFQQAQIQNGYNLLGSVIGMPGQVAGAAAKGL